MRAPIASNANPGKTENRLDKFIWSKDGLDGPQKKYATPNLVLCTMCKWSAYK